MRLLKFYHLQRGIVVVQVAIALSALTAAAAVAVDLGRVVAAAQTCQNAADAAALAGANGPIIGHPSEVSDRVEGVIGANSSSHLSLTCDPNAIHYYTGGNAIPGYGVLPDSTEAVGVTVATRVPFYFASALGVSGVQVERSAVASRRSDTPQEALFAMASGPKDTGVAISGQSCTIDGQTHSNSMVQISGGYCHFTDVIEWCALFHLSGQNCIFDGGVVESEVEPPPIVFTPDQFAPFDYEVDKYQISTGGYVVPPGVYRVHGNVSISAANVVMDNVTFVADGQVQISGQNCVYTANRNGVFAFSMDTGSNAIQVSGGGNGCRGMLYAPNGDAHFSGTAMTTTVGSIVAQHIQISGGYFTLLSSPELGGNTRITLIQ